VGIEFEIPALDQAGAYRTDLLIGAMSRFEHEPATRSVLTGENLFGPGTPNVILIAATLVFFFKNAAIARLLRGVILYDL
jgi:hypothetical protein